MMLMMNVIQQNIVTLSGWTWKNVDPLLQARNLCSSHLPKEDQVPVESSAKKLLKVAIIGRPNAGKSTLINTILNMNVCDVSRKTHTTRLPIKASFIFKNTQIVFIDTPGLVSKAEFSRFDLKDCYITWKRKVLEEIDMVGIIHEAPLIDWKLKFHSTLVQTLQDIDESKPVFLIINKVDKVKNKVELLEATEKLYKANAQDKEENNNPELSIKRKQFSRVFFTSALKSDGVSDIVNYLLDEAKEGEWILDGKVFDVPLDVLIQNLLRARIMNMLPQEIPYVCGYEIEYLEENNLGEIICVALIVCQKLKHVKIILSKHKAGLKYVSKEIESDLYNILKKVLRLRIVVIHRKHKTK